jgi:hypothetical protein
MGMGSIPRAPQAAAVYCNVSSRELCFANRSLEVEHRKGSGLTICDCTPDMS